MISFMRNKIKGGPKKNSMAQEVTYSAPVPETKEGKSVSTEEAPIPVKAAPPEPAPVSVSDSPPPGSFNLKPNLKGSEDQEENAVQSILPVDLAQDTLTKLVRNTHFDSNGVKDLYQVFRRISSSEDDDGMIDKAEFRLALGLRDSLFLHRIFSLFDENGDHNISFEEFITGLSIFSANAPKEQKMQFCFKIYDMDEDGFISQEELSRMVTTLVVDAGIKMTTKDIEHVIERTFEQTDTKRDGVIDFEEFRAMVQKHPQVLENMTIKSLPVS